MGKNQRIDKETESERKPWVRLFVPRIPESKIAYDLLLQAGFPVTTHSEEGGLNFLRDLKARATINGRYCWFRGLKGIKQLITKYAA